MPEAGPSVLVRICKRKLVSDRILFQEAEGVADADVVVRFGKESGAHKIRPEHDEEVRARPRVLSTARAFGTAGGGTL